MRIFVLLLLLLYPASAEIIEVYPNPFKEEEEYVKIFCHGNCIFTDFEKEIKFGRGVHYLAKNATAFKDKFGFYPDADGISLSNNGELIALIEENSTEYFNWVWRYLDEGVVYYKENGKWDFRYEGWSSFKPVEDEVSGKLILCPCDYKLKGEGVVYSYTIYDAESFEGDFTFAVDANPVGGIPLNVKILEENNEVYYLKSKIYKNFHAKFAVVGDKVVITTENWKWDKRGVVVEFSSKKISKTLKDVFYNDLKYSSKPKSFKNYVKVERGNGKSFDFSGKVTLYVMPENNPVFDFIRNAKKRLYLVAPNIDFEYFNGTPLLDEILNASKRGVDVKILVSYGDLEFLENQGVEVEKLENPKIHGKYLISEDSVLITSANLNKYGLKLNREIALKIEDKKLADKLAEEFLRDFKKGFDEREYIYLLLSSIGFFVAVLIFLKRQQS
ncbi:conserved hypothetical protein [Ferroglobus placidus DSM 10642]|uniref:Phospholipase D-like domain-containing protein n=1 Tax=Ferroglobus placidus (strain DSM 10642 / AEDII12DO) TaxID=589924 RepID=D3RWR0_FERPA|nr:phospholipase D-like domain-containing protein [Ferroglobus placidus]ADC64923.1 conserved hypothetical protein [Ferroglobus placidus DSM 10642]